jgi:phosphohistidine phosphatase
MWSLMHRLMLLRHAKSDWSAPGMPDHERVINDRGRDTAAKVGAYIDRHALAPDHVLCSTALRARLTWELVAAKFAGSPPVRFERRLYNATPDALLDVLHGLDDDVRSVLMIGHNPGLQGLADGLIASGDLDHRERLREKLPTAGLVVIDFAVDSWRQLRPKTGRLERFIVPKWLETATD